MAQEYKLILKYADEAGFTRDIECYLRHGGYDDAEKSADHASQGTLADGKTNFPRRNKSART